MSILQDLLALNISTPVVVAEQDDEPKHKGIMAKSDEFTVEVDGDSEMIDIRDGEGSIRVTMPRDVWIDLCKQTIKAED